MMRRVILACAVALACAGCASAPTDGSEDGNATAQRGRLLAALFGSSAAPTATGVEAELRYTAQSVSNLAGGVDRGTTYLDSAEAAIEIDAGTAFGARGGRIGFRAFRWNGGDPSGELLGDTLGASGIAADRTTRILEAFYEQTFAADGISLLAGLYDLNSEFDANETGSLFMHGAHGMGTDFAQSGANGPSSFPVTAVGARIQAEVSEGLSWRVAVVDGIAGDPDRPRGTRVALDRDDGVLIATELDWQGDATDVPLRIVLGGWRYTASFERLDRDDGSRSRGNAGGYVLVEATLAGGERTPSKLDAFVRAGLAAPRFNRTSAYVGAGLVWTAPFRRRPDDAVGLAVAAGSDGSAFRRTARRNDESTSTEVAIELTYRAAIAEWLAVQPGVLYVANPTGSGTRTDDAIAALLSVEIVL